MSASLATSCAGALERFHECLLSGASAKNTARSSHAFKKNEVKQQADMRPRRRGGYSIRLFCVWASRRQESLCSSLVRHRAAWNHQRTPFQQRLGAQMGTVFGACVADFFSNMARKVVDFQGLLLGAFFVPVFAPGLLTCAARVPIFGPKIWTPSRGQKHNSDSNYLCPLLWRPVALELWSGSMNVC